MLKTRRLSPTSPGNNEAKEVDRISKLPDAVIHNILSSIDANYAVQTSVLSKRWKHIWKSLPFLNFDMYGDKFDKVNDLVERVLLLRDNSNIQWFRFRGSWFSPSLSKWIDAVVNRKVQDVTLELYQKKHRVCNTISYEIPHSLLNCKSLEKLTLMSHAPARAPVKYVFPKSISLPQLRFMGLGGIDVESFTLLFSSCPFLESLKIGQCDLQTAECIVELLAAYDKVEQLQLSPEFLEVLSGATVLLNSPQLPVLNNLQCLEMETCITYGSLCSIAYFLAISLNVKTLILKLNWSNSVRTGNNDGEVAEIVLRGMLPHLKFLRIEEMEGHDAELIILGSLFKNASVLEEVALFFRFNVSLSSRARQANQLRYSLRPT